MLKVSIICILIFLFMDALWIGLVVKNLYSVQFGSLINSPAPRWLGVILAYVGIISGIIFLVLTRVDSGSLMAIVFGALYGFATYGTYAFTSYAIFSNWPLSIALCEVLWGMIICGTTSYLASWFLP
jgi:uncharacterized membrane protein